MRKRFRIINTPKGILNITAANLFNTCCGTGIDGTFTSADNKSVTVEDGLITAITLLGPALTGFDSSSAPHVGDVCVDEPSATTTTFYHDGEEETPQNGDTVYTDIGGTTFPEDGWYSDGISWYQVTEGVVNRTLNCE